MERFEDSAFWPRLRRIALALCVAAELGASQARAGEASPSVEPIRCLRNLQFQIPGDTQKLDLYLPPGTGNRTRAAVIWIHGGKGDKADSRERTIASFLAQSGYACASMNYGDDGPFLDNILATKAAVRFVRLHAKGYGIDPDRIAIGGGSYGGYLALMIGFARSEPHFEPDHVYPGVSDAVAAVIDFYGPTDYMTVSQPNRPKLRAPPEEYEAAYADFAHAFSPVTYVTSSGPPVFIAQGKDDFLVDFSQATELDRVLTAKGVVHQLVLMDGVGHGFDLTGSKSHPLPRDLRPLILGFLEKTVGR